MKILIIGLVAFMSWSALTTYLYVCKIKGLCSETEIINTVTNYKSPVLVADTLSDKMMAPPAPFPDDHKIYFEFDRSEFIPDGGLAAYYDLTLAYMYQNLDARLGITGYTDATGSDDYNQALGYRRAAEVQTYFESKGIPAEKIIKGSKGEKDPAETNTSAEGRSKNRRVVITINK